MPFKRKKLEARNLKQRENNLQSNNITKNKTAEQKAIAHSNESLNSSNNANSSEGGSNKPSRKNILTSPLTSNATPSNVQTSNDVNNVANDSVSSNQVSSNFNQSSSNSNLRSSNSSTSNLHQSDSGLRSSNSNSNLRSGSSQSNNNNSNSLSNSNNLSNSNSLSSSNSPSNLSEGGSNKQSKKNILTSPLTSNATPSNVQTSNDVNNVANDSVSSNQVSSNFNQSSSNSNLRSSNLHQSDSGLRSSNSNSNLRSGNSQSNNSNPNNQSNSDSKSRSDKRGSNKQSKKSLMSPLSPNTTPNTVQTSNDVNDDDVNDGVNDDVNDSISGNQSSSKFNKSRPNNNVKTSSKISSNVRKNNSSFSNQPNLHKNQSNPKRVKKRFLLANQAQSNNSNNSNPTNQPNENTDELVSTPSMIKNGTSNLIKKGVKAYKKELEQGDLGVKVAGQSITATGRTVKISKQAFQKLKHARNRTRNKESVLTSIKETEARIQSTKKEIKKLKMQLSSGTPKSAQVRKKLKSKQAELKSLQTSLKNKKTNTSKNFIKKGIVAPATSTLKNGVDSYQKEIEKGDMGVEVTSKGSKLVKQGVTQLNLASEKLRKGKVVGNTQKGKLSHRSFKLKKQNANIQKVATSKKLQKKAIKKNLVSKNRNRLLGSVSGVVGNAKTTLLNYVKNLSFVAVKKAILGKVALAVGSSSSILIPVLLILTLVFSIGIIGSLFGQYKQQVNGTIGVAKNLSPEVEQWRDLVTQEATAQGMESYIDLILAIIQVESGGHGPDIMQSSESAGHPPNYFQTELESVRQGISYLKSIVGILQGYGMGFENNARLIAQSYNFGSPFARYVGNRGGTYDLNTAEDYSRTVVAPSLGNTTGEKNKYVNAVSKSFNKPYLYRNGGNFFYGELVGQYLGRPSNVQGEFATVLGEIEKFNGWEYVWGGKSDSVGFDCSGLVAWGLKEIGIDLPSPASNQYAMTVPIDASEAQPGDLIFFRGTYGSANHISHVGFYIDENTMYDANGSGVGYHNWKSSYWLSHKPEIRRVVQ